MGPAVYKYFAAVTPHDTNPSATFPITGIYVGGTGDLAVLTHDGQTVVFQSLPAGTFLPISIARILDTNTDATEIVAMGLVKEGSFN